LRERRRRPRTAAPSASSAIEVGSGTIATQPPVGEPFAVRKELVPNATATSIPGGVSLDPSVGVTVTALEIWK
jgi:hypothetical protein